ncbi:MAG: TonB-dependent receptor [Acidobacteria bacterium]|nr:TonB-dependent receptor [Acidobacteriota bacterium]
MKSKGLRKWQARWIAAGTLAMCAVSSARAAAVAAAAEGEGGSGAGQANLPVRKFDIQGGSLDAALEQFRTQSAVDVKIRIKDGQDLSGVQTKGVRGLYSAPVALRLLLEDTGLSYRATGTGHYEITLRAHEEVSVDAAANSVALSQFTESLTDTAQTVNVVPHFIMQEQQANTLKETLRNIPGISLAAGEGGAQGDNLTIRGFSARNDMFLDGIRDFGSYYRDSFNYESVAVLQGPASVEFGRGSTGGVINQESKTPMPNAFTRGGLQFGTNLTRRINIDVNKPIKDFADGTAFRLNLVGTQSKVAGRDYAEIRRFGVAPSIAFGLNSNTRYSLSYLHEAEDSLPDYGLPYFYDHVAGVDRHNYYGFANDNWLRTSPDVVTGRVDHDFNERFSVRNTLRWGNYPRDVRITEPQVATTLAVPSTIPTDTTKAFYRDNSGIIYANCTSGNSCTPVDTPIAAVNVTRNQIQAKSVEDILWDQASLIGRLKVAGIENNFILLAEGGRERSNPVRPKYTVASTPATNPNPQDLFAPTKVTAATVAHVASQSFGLNFLDTLKLTRWLQLSGGVRFDYFNTHSDVYTPTNPVATQRIFTDRLDKKPTYRAAVVVKPRQNGTIYFDYGTSFNPSGESLSLSANNADQAPEENETYEVGTKWDALNGRLNLSGSWFRTRKLNAKETDPLDSTQVNTVGTQLVQGVQIGAIGHLSHHMDLIFGYAYLDGTLEYSTLNASPFAAINAKFASKDPVTGVITVLDPRFNTAPYYINPAGFPLANVAKNTGNLWITHNLGFRFVGGFGGNYVGARRASSSSMIALYPSAPTPVADIPLAFKSLPGYWNFDAMLRRPITDALSLQVNVYNLANNFYIAQPHPNHLIPGEGINAQIGLHARF